MIRRIVMTLTVWLTLFSLSFAQESPDYESLLKELLPKIGDPDIEQRKSAQQKWESTCFRASHPNETAMRKAICQAMIGVLETESRTPAQVFLIRQLERIGGEDCVPVLAKLTQSQDPRVRDSARRALVNIPHKSAGDALRSMLAQLKDLKDAPAIINSLGDRGEPESVDVLFPLSAALYPNIMKASILALAKIDHPSAEKAVRKRFEAELRPSDLSAFANAYMIVADRAFQRGDKKQAGEMYRRLVGEKLKGPIRLAAIRGRLQTAELMNESAGELVEKYLLADDPGLRQVAAGHVRELGNEGIGKLAARCNEFPRESQLAFLKAVGPTRNQAALDGVLKLVESEDADIRLAAIGALGGLANESTVPVLVHLMLEGGPAGDAAARSLVQVHAAGIDEKLVHLMKASKDVDRRLRFMQVLDRRRSIQSIPAILEETRHHDRKVRDAALRYLQRLASAGHIPPMIAIALQTEDRGERDQVEKAIVTVCRRTPDADKQADPVLAVFRESSREAELQLLPLLGRLGGEKCLKVVRQAVDNSVDSERFDAGVQALSNWPNADVTSDLMRVSTHQDPGIRIRSVRALARVVVLRDQRTDQERLKLLTQTMKKAERDQERQLILDRAKSIRLVETLRFVLPYVDNEKLQEQACRTVVELAHHRGLREPNQQEFDQALTKVIEATGDQKLAERAKGYMSKK